MDIEVLLVIGMLGRSAPGAAADVIDARTNAAL
jgi:hypothetical protein